MSCASPFRIYAHYEETEPRGALDRGLDKEEGDAAYAGSWRLSPPRPGRLASTSRSHLHRNVTVSDLTNKAPRRGDTDESLRSTRCARESTPIRHASNSLHERRSTVTLSYIYFPYIYYIIYLPTAMRHASARDHHDFPLRRSEQPSPIRRCATWTSRHVAPEHPRSGLQRHRFDAIWPRSCGHARQGR